MKFIISSSSLLKHLQQISGVVASNTVLPILEDFLFTINQKKLQVVATDLETLINISMDIESEDEGSICIPAKILMDTLKNLPDQPLTFNIDENHAVEITSESGKYKLMGEDADQFPKAPSADDTSVFTIKSNILLTGINKTIFAVSNDDLRPAMNGVFFELDKQSFQMVATDAHRLVKFLRNDVNPKGTSQFIVPKKPLNLLKNVIPDNEDELTISYNKNHFFVKHGEVELSCRLIDARFPDYKVVIPKENPYKLTVSKSDIQGSLKRVSVFANKSTNLVILTIRGTELQLSAQDIDFNSEGNERLQCTYEGEDMQIAFNSKLILELINVVDTEDVLIELSTPKKAALVKPSTQSDNEDLLMLAMPLMIND